MDFIKCLILLKNKQALKNNNLKLRQMKRFTFLTFLTAAFMFSVLVITSCTKEGAAGKDGVDGAVGPAGPRGEAGVDGTDGTAGCVLCHTGGEEQGMFAQVNQWEHSVHATGGNFERNNSCGVCHTSQGFLANLAGTFDGLVENPNPINCYTCHNIHKTFTPADLALTTTATVELMVGGDVVDFGKGNLCATCHQARTISNAPVIDGPDYKITSNRFGGHHGPQANILAGNGLYEFSGTEGLGINTHANFVEDACVTCHMAAAYGTQAGGHTMKMGYDYHGTLEKNLAGCLDCHTDATELETIWDETQEEVEALIIELRTILTEKGVYNPADGLAKPGTYKANYAAAYINYQLIEEDRSKGVHNPGYVIGILKNTIAKIK